VLAPGACHADDPDAMKNIILCSDGTGNTAIKGRGTNVFKLFEAVDLNEHLANPELDAQLAFYDDGVGTEGVVFKRAIGGATGWGLKSNVKQLYRELSRVYDDGDRIFLFGFSRGAFTVRTLAGMIGMCGVLKGESFATAQALRAAVDEVYVSYRARYDSTLTRFIGRLRGRPAGEGAVAAFCDRFSKRDQLSAYAPIAFIGVWDTVDAVGMPFRIADIVNRRIFPFKFWATGLGAHVQKACHALSIDDPRVAFEPVLWDGPDDRIEQVWFSGVHSNVGGGYPKQGMSLVALDWMLAHAETAGLRLLKLDHELFRGHASVDDMMYDPRSGMGIFYRWAPRDIRAYCERISETPRIHLTVAERIAHGTDDYAPGNIPPNAIVAFTPPAPQDPHREEKTRVLRQRSEAIQAEIQRALKGGYPLESVKSELALGHASYWLFMASWAGFIVAGLGAAAAAMLRRPNWSYQVSAVLVASVVGFVTAVVLARRAENGMNDRFSLFWQKHQKDLRAALKQAHQQARDDKMRT
jgi:uncharacterized protein (DUF2235 family)